MRTTLLTLALAALSAQPDKLSGRWIGNVQTEHGSAPLELTVRRSDSAAAYRMTFMQAELQGQVRGWKVAGDSLQFVIGFLTNVGGIEFRFAGAVNGTEASGNFVGLRDGQERGRGPWSLTRQP